MPKAECDGDRNWSFSSPNRRLVLNEILKKHKSVMIPDGSGVNGNMQHLYSGFTITEDDMTINAVIAQKGKICIDTGIDYNRPLRSDNSGSE